MAKRSDKGKEKIDDQEKSKKKQAKLIMKSLDLVPSGSSSSIKYGKKAAKVTHNFVDAYDPNNPDRIRDAAISAAVEVAYATLANRHPVTGVLYAASRFWGEGLVHKAENYNPPQPQKPMTSLDPIQKAFALNLYYTEQEAQAITRLALNTAATPQRLVEGTKKYLREKCDEHDIREQRLVDFTEEKYREIAAYADAMLQDVKLFPSKIVESYQQLRSKNDSQLEDILANYEFMMEGPDEYFPPEVRDISSSSSSSTSSNSSNQISKEDAEFFSHLATRLTKLIKEPAGEQSTSSTTSLEEKIDRIDKTLEHQKAREEYQNTLQSYRDIGNGLASIATFCGSPRTGMKLKSLADNGVTIFDNLNKLGAFGASSAALAATATSSALSSLGSVGTAISAAAPYVAIAGAFFSLATIFFGDDEDDGLGEALEAIMGQLSFISENVIELRKELHEFRKEVYSYHVEQMQAMLKIYQEQKRQGSKFSQFKHELRKEFRKLQQDNAEIHRSLDNLTDITRAHYSEIKDVITSLKIADLNHFLGKVQDILQLSSSQKGIEEKDFDMFISELKRYGTADALTSAYTGSNIDISSTIEIIKALSKGSYISNINLLNNYANHLLGQNNPALANPYILVLVLESITKLVEFQLNRKNPTNDHDKEINIMALQKLKDEINKIDNLRRELINSEYIEKLFDDYIHELRRVKEEIEEKAAKFEKDFVDARKMVIRHSFEENQSIVASQTYPMPDYIDKVRNFRNNLYKNFPNKVRPLISPIGLWDEKKLSKYINSLYRTALLATYNSTPYNPKISVREIVEYRNAGEDNAYRANQENFQNTIQTWVNNLDNNREQLENRVDLCLFASPSLRDGYFSMDRTLKITYRDKTFYAPLNPSFISINEKYLIAEKNGLGKIIYESGFSQGEFNLKAYFIPKDEYNKKVLIKHYKCPHEQSIDTNPLYVAMQAWFGGRDLKTNSQISLYITISGKKNKIKNLTWGPLNYPRMEPYEGLSSIVARGDVIEVVIPGIAAFEQEIDAKNKKFMRQKRKEFHKQLFLDTKELEAKFYILRASLEFIYGEEYKTKAFNYFRQYDNFFKKFKESYNGKKKYLHHHIAQMITSLSTARVAIRGIKPGLDELYRYDKIVYNLIQEYKKAKVEEPKPEQQPQIVSIQVSEEKQRRREEKERHRREVDAKIDALTKSNEALTKSNEQLQSQLLEALKESKDSKKQLDQLTALLSQFLFLNDQQQSSSSVQNIRQAGRGANLGH